MAKIWRAGAIGHTGQGNYGHHLHLAYKGLPGVEMAAIADPNDEGREAARVQTGARTAYADWREMLDKEDLDIVSVCPRWVTDHCEMVVACAEAGCHVYCEKAIARDPAEADRMVEACDAAGVKLAVSHQSRYVEPYLTLREEIRRGDLGRLLAIYGRGKEDARGGGEDMIVLGTHVFDRMRFLVGDPQWVFGHVTADGRPVAHEDGHEGTEPVGPVAGDEIVALYGFADELRGHFESRRGLGSPARGMGVTVVGEEATISVYGNECEYTLSRGPHSAGVDGNFETVRLEQEPGVPGAKPLERHDFIARGNRRAIWDMIQAIEEDRDPVSAGRDARWALDMILGVYASHLQGGAVPLPLEDRRHPLDPPE